MEVRCDFARHVTLEKNSFVEWLTRGKSGGPSKLRVNKPPHSKVESWLDGVAVATILDSLHSAHL